MTTSNNRASDSSRGQVRRGRRAFREALADEPNQPTLMINLGIALRFAGERQEARALFEKSFPTRTAGARPGTSSRSWRWMTGPRGARAHSCAPFSSAWSVGRGGIALASVSCSNGRAA
jgi:hypothetical protein